MAFGMHPPTLTYRMSPETSHGPAEYPESKKGRFIMEKFLCVYSSSSCAIDEIYFSQATKLGEAMAQRDYGLIFGGGMVGLMGATARAIHNHGGRVVGVIPQALNKKGIVYENCDELIVTGEMRERKATMEERATGFIALPGGFGTLEELLEIITLKQLRYHNKPIVILNINNFYDGLVKIFDNIINLKFAKEQSRDLYYITEDINNALDYLDEYQPRDLGSKWFTKKEVEKGEKA